MLPLQQNATHSHRNCRAPAEPPSVSRLIVACDECHNAVRAVPFGKAFFSPQRQSICLFSLENGPPERPCGVSKTGSEFGLLGRANRQNPQDIKYVIPRTHWGDDSPTDCASRSSILTCRPSTSGWSEQEWVNSMYVGYQWSPEGSVLGESPKWSTDARVANLHSMFNFATTWPRATQKVASAHPETSESGALRWEQL